MPGSWCLLMCNGATLKRKEHVTEIHLRIINELVERFRDDNSVVAISLFGSWAKSSGRRKSDIDIEILSKSANKWQLSQEEKYGVRIDIVVVPHDHFLRQTETHPFLCYNYLSEKILHDPYGIMAKARADLEAYFSSHPEIVEYWENDLEAMRDKKKRGVHRMKDIIWAYDQAELRFSKDHTISRDFLRE